MIPTVFQKQPVSCNTVHHRLSGVTVNPQTIQIQANVVTVILHQLSKITELVGAVCQPSTFWMFSSISFHPKSFVIALNHSFSVTLSHLKACQKCAYVCLCHSPAHFISTFSSRNLPTMLPCFAFQGFVHSHVKISPLHTRVTVTYPNQLFCHTSAPLGTLPPPQLHHPA